MDGRVIPLPSLRALGEAGTGSEAVQEQIAVLSVELRPVEGESRELPGLVPEVIERIHERCIRAALVVAGRRGGRLSLAGTSTHPVVEARFRGAGAAARAANAALEIAGAVAESQRSDERRMEACVGVGVGEASMSPVGVRITRGSPLRVAERLRELAGPGIVLLGGAGAEEAALELGADPQQGPRMDPSMPPVPTWCLSTQIDDRT